MPTVIVSTILAIGLFFIQADGIVDGIYTQWYSEFNEKWQQRFPAEFVGPAQIIIVFVWVLLIIIGYRLYFHISKFRSHLYYFNPQFYHENSSFCHVYFHERINELTSGTLSNFWSESEAHNQSIVRTLYSLRDALGAGYKEDDIRITLMRPIDAAPGKEGADEDNRKVLKIFHWANEKRTTPITRKKGIYFGTGEGYAGVAMLEGVPQIGGKYRWGIFKDPRFKKTSSGHDLVKSFFSMPLFNGGPQEDGRPLLAILNVDATKKHYFPRGIKRQRAFCEALQPFISVITLHLLWIDSLSNSQAAKKTPGQTGA